MARIGKQIERMAQPFVEQNAERNPSVMVCGVVMRGDSWRDGNRSLVASGLEIVWRVDDARRGFVCILLGAAPDDV